MRLLILTQKMNKEDPVLGFFHNWVLKLSLKFESIIVICLEKGEYDLPQNVKVLSLGKEKGSNRLQCIFQFFNLCFFQSLNYQAVFVHMNEEYILLGGLFWRLLGKKVFMWRNHHAGSSLTDLAALFCYHVFCTSKYSYTAKYKKTILMPVGVDLNKFIKFPSSKVYKVKNSILFLGRIAETKNVHVFVEALDILKQKGIDFTASIYGDALPRDLPYFEKLKLQVKNLGLENNLEFHKGVPNDKTPEIYNTHQIYVNLSSDGMYDKTIFESLACGCLALASNLNLKGQIDERLVIENKEPEKICQKLETILSLDEEVKAKIISQNMEFVKSHSLEALINKLKLIIH